MHEKTRIYDMLSIVLTDFEEGRADDIDLYQMLVDIQNNWETIITAER